MMNTKQKQKQIILAHYGLGRKITRQECEMVLQTKEAENIFVDFEACSEQLDQLYHAPFENIALTQHRKFIELVKPLLDNNPGAHIAYFGLVPISVAFHLGYLVGNTHSYTIYQWHHARQVWYWETDPPNDEYNFSIKPMDLPKERQKGKGDVVIRIGTSFSIDPQTTYDVVRNPANEFDIELFAPDVDSLHNQQIIQTVVTSFQEALNAYSSKLNDREQIHLFISSSSGLPFALGTRINTNVYPFIQTYQYDRRETPRQKQAILITSERVDRAIITEEDKKAADELRNSWQDQLQNRLKPFVKTVTGVKSANWLQSVCQEDEEYLTVSSSLRGSWQSVANLGETTLKDDRIDISVKNVDDGFEYIEKNNTWLLDDGFLSGLKRRLEKDSNTDVMQAGRLFFFHEALHYSKSGHRLTREVANGIGQFPKVIEEADYQADVWALLTEYRYCCIYESLKLKSGLKQFFCNTIDTAVETMWSFVDTGVELRSFQIRSMNRFLNWYWQWLLIEDLPATGTFKEIVDILFNKPVIEFAGAPIELRAHRSLYKLDSRNLNNLQLATFSKNRVYRFAPNAIEDILTGFQQLKGEKIKTALKSFQVSID